MKIKSQLFSQMVNFVLHIYSTGRAFILRGKDEIKTELEGIMKSNDTDIQEYEVKYIKQARKIWIKV